MLLIEKTNIKYSFGMCIAILLIYYGIIIIQIPNIGYSDFLSYFNGTRTLFTFEWENTYNFEYYASISVPPFVYLPAFCFMFIPFAINEIVGLTMWLTFNLICSITSVFILYKITIKLNFRKAHKIISILLYSFYIQHYWNAHAVQRNDVGSVIILYIILRNLNGDKGSILMHVLLTMISAIYPYMILFYGIFILRYLNLKNILKCIIIFSILNFPLIFLWKDLFNHFWNFRNNIDGETDLVWSFEYNVIGIIYIFTLFSHPTLISVFLMLSFVFLLFILHRDADLLQLMIYFSFIFIFLNIMLIGIHMLNIYPFLIIYCFGRKESDTTKVIPILNLIAIFLISLPIPYAVFQLLNIEQFAVIKRVSIYFLFIPSLLRDYRNRLYKNEIKYYPITKQNIRKIHGRFFRICDLDDDKIKQLKDIAINYKFDIDETMTEFKLVHKLIRLRKTEEFNLWLG